MTDADDEWTVDFIATSISLGTCSSSFAEPALDGHYLALAFDVPTETGTIAYRPADVENGWTGSY